MFVEYLTEKIKRGDNTQTPEQARNQVFRILSQPRQAKAFWGEFKRSLVNVSRTVERDRAQGIKNPYTPTWTSERVEPTLEQAQTAGEMIMAVNEANAAALAASDTSQPTIASNQSNEGLPGNAGGSRLPNSIREYLPPESVPPTDEVDNFASSKSQVAAESTSPAIKQLSEGFSMSRAVQPEPPPPVSELEELNIWLSDPILRKEVMPRVMRSDRYTVEFNEYGEPIAVVEIKQ
jgi:hypothetical protein